MDAEDPKFIDVIGCTFSGRRFSYYPMKLSVEAGTLGVDEEMPGAAPDSAVLRFVGPKLVGFAAQVSLSELLRLLSVDAAYWLAVRAGVAGRRAERADVLESVNVSAAEAVREEDRNYAEACRPASDYLDNLSDYIEHGDHVGAARRAKHGHGSRGLG